MIPERVASDRTLEHDERARILTDFFGKGETSWDHRAVLQLLVGGFLLLVIVSDLGSSGSNAPGPGCSCGALVLLPATLLIFSGLWRLQLASSLRPISPELALQLRSTFSEGVHQLSVSSLKLLDLEEQDMVSDPMLLSSPKGRRGDTSVEPPLSREVGPGMVLWAAYRITILFFTEERVAIFCCDYDFILDEITSCETYEYHYRDIVAVSVARQAASSGRVEGQQGESKELRLSVSSGETLRLVAGSSGLRSDDQSTDEVGDCGAERAARALRAMIRDKKR